MRWLLVLAACGSSPRPPPAPPPKPFDWAGLDVPGPPDLPAVEQVNACEPFDEQNPACLGDPRMCTLGHADCKCPTPPDVALAPCWAVMPCPATPDPRVRACARFFPGPPASAVLARVIGTRVGPGLTIVIGAGADQGLDRTWHATLLDGESGEPLPGGDATIVRVDQRTTTAKVKLTIDQIPANPRVRFTP